MSKRIELFRPLYNALTRHMARSGLMLFANTGGVCTSFKTELLLGHHNFGVGVVRAATTADTFKAALYLASATVGPSSTAYTSTGEVTGTGYTATGVTVTNGVAPTSSGTTAYWTPSASFAWTTMTAGPFDALMLYNSTQSNKAVAVFTFSSQTIAAANFTLTQPANAVGTALLRLA